MPLPFLIGYHRLTKNENPDTVYNTYTCPNDGFVRAWGDPYDNTLIWLFPTCPVDAIRASLVTNIANFVNTNYTYQQDSDSHQRVLHIIAKTKADAREWLQKNSMPIVGDFLSDDMRLQTLIVDELVKQGAIS